MDKIKRQYISAPHLTKIHIVSWNSMSYVDTECGRYMRTIKAKLTRPRVTRPRGKLCSRCAQMVAEEEK
jgi:hypothetical protein